MTFKKGNIPWNKDKKGIYSLETKEKMSIVKRGENNPNYDKHFSTEHRQKIGESQKGGKNHNYGKHFSKELKKKISEALKITFLSPEIRTKMSESRKNKHPSQITREKLSESKSGSNNPSWKGGISSLTNRIRRCFKYRQWLSDIYTRDDFTCQECGIRGGNLNAHHIKSFSSILQFYEITTLEEALECEELWNLNNGITFCKKCHRDFHKSKKLIKERKANCNGMDNGNRLRL